MDDAMLAGVITAVFFIFGVLVGASIGYELDSNTLKKFPICIEQDFGKEKIKKCYDIVELNE